MANKQLINVFMKKNHVLIPITIGLVMGVAIALLLVSNSNSAIFPEEIESLTGSEGCLVIPGDLKGICKQNVNGTEYNCVEATWLQRKDCTSD